MHLSRNKALQFSLALMILGVGLNYEHFLWVFDFRGWYLGWILSIPFLARYLRLYGSILLFVLALTIPSAIAFAAGSYTSSKSIFTLAFFLFLLVYAKTLVKVVGHEAIISVYAKLGVVHAIFLILNETIYLASHSLSFAVFGETESMSLVTRATGLFLEPSEAALYLVPALVYYFIKRHYALFSVIFVAMIATFSSLTYIALVLSLLLAMYLRRASLANLSLSILLVFFIFAAATTSPQIVARVDTIFNVVDAWDLDFNSYNSSIATVLMNSLVAKDSLFGSNFVGIGFGNFEYAFNRYAGDYFPAGYDGEGLFWNRNTGGSLFIRVAAELGGVGIAILVYVLYRLLKAYHAVRRSSIDKLAHGVGQQVYIISSIVIFVICLLRKDSLTNVHLFIFLVGALMLPISSLKGTSDRVYRLKSL